MDQNIFYSKKGKCTISRYRYRHLIFLKVNISNRLKRNNFSSCRLKRLSKGAFVWDESGIRIIGIMQVSVRLAALPIPEYLDFHSSYYLNMFFIAGYISGCIYLQHKCIAVAFARCHTILFFS